MSSDDTITVTAPSGPNSPNGNEGGHSQNASSASDVTSLTVAKLRAFDAVFAQQLTAFIVLNEGVRYTIYFDTVGNSTTGVGFGLGSVGAAQQLPFNVNKTYHGHGDEWSVVTAATASQIEGGYNSALATYNDASLSDSAKNTRWASAGLFLTNGNIATKLADNLKAAYNEMKGVFPDFDSYPTSAKVGIMDMDYNLGLTKFNGFTKFQAAVKNRDWATAATESHRVGVGARNDRTAAKFNAAANGQ